MKSEDIKDLIMLAAGMVLVLSTWIGSNKSSK